MIGKVTLFESPDVLAKTWKLDAIGAPVKTVAAQLYRGTYRQCEFETVDDLAGLLSGVTTHQAISCSLPTDGSVSGRITTKRAADPGAKVRCKYEFSLLPTPAMVFLDHDSANEASGMTRDELWHCLLEAVPALANAGVVWRPSGSSHVYQGNNDLTGLRGQHLFAMLADGSDGPRVIKVLAARLWLAGLGMVQVSSAGSLLERGPIDTAPSDAARLIFAGGAECGAGLEQRRGPPVILNRGSFLDSRAFVPDLTSDEQGRYEALVEQAKLAASPEAARRRAEHRGASIAKRLPDMMKKGMSAADAELRIGAAVDAAYGGTLLSDFELTAVHDDGRCEVVTVGEVLAARDRWNEIDVLDVINPGHRQGAADCRLYLHGTSPIAYSLDDGGTVYRLRSAQQRLIVAKGSRGELVSQIAATVAADDRVFVNEAGPVLVERGKILTLTVDRLMNLIGVLLVLVVKTAKGEALTDVTREQAVLVLAALGS
jgi:hypothetical protein